VLVEKQVGVSFAGVQLAKILRDYNAFSIRPRTSADSTARVGRLVAIVRIPLGAQVSAPGLVTETDCARQLLANLIRAAQPAQVGRLAPSATDKKAHGRTDLGAFSANTLAPITADDTERRHRREKKDRLLHKLFLWLKFSTPRQPWSFAAGQQATAQTLYSKKIKFKLLSNKIAEAT
jgi:hypothetical protein